MERTDKEPLPIALYQIDKINKIQKGVIVVAKVVEGIDKVDERIRNTEKHEEVRQISEEEIDDFKGETINDFKNTLHKVFDMWDTLFDK